MLELREELTPKDPARLYALAAATGFFSREEAEVAAELAEERLARGAASGYHFLLAEEAGELLGFACFGPIPCTRAFYRACGFHQEALLADFYDRNDGKVIFCKVLDPTSHR